MKLRHLKTSGEDGSRTIAGNRVHLLHDPEHCLPAMLEAIEGATHEVLLEMYWFGSDSTGLRFADALIGRARAGVSVRVIYDAVGSIDTDDALFQRMRSAGVQVAEYNPIAPWRHRFQIGVVNNRDHRKMIVVDGERALTGGVNIGDPWAAVEDGGEGWRDDVIALEGPVAQAFRQVFLHTWSELTEAPEPGAPAAPLADDSHEAERLHLAESPGSTPVRVLANHYRDERKAIRQAYLRRIRRAGRYLYLTNSYFVPDATVRRALRSAVRRGVDVRVLVPASSDVPAVDLASRRVWSRLMKDGVRIFRWHGPVLHAKSAVSDDIWTTVGSFNLDYRSWRHNLELNVAVEDDGLARAMRDRFLADLGEAEEVDPTEHRRRPLWIKLLEWVFFLFRALL